MRHGRRPAPPSRPRWATLSWLVRGVATGRSLRALAAAALVPVAILAVAACGDQGETAAGVVLAVDSTGGSIQGFTLRATDGTTMTFTIGDLEADGAAFPASHLVVHAVSADPISVAYRVVNGRNVVYRMVDAPWAGSATPSPSGASPPTAPSGASPPTAPSGPSPSP